MPGDTKEPIKMKFDWIPVEGPERSYTTEQEQYFISKYPPLKETE